MVCGGQHEVLSTRSPSVAPHCLISHASLELELTVPRKKPVQVDGGVHVVVSGPRLVRAGAGLVRTGIVVVLVVVTMVEGNTGNWNER